MIILIAKIMPIYIFIILINAWIFITVELNEIFIYKYLLNSLNNNFFLKKLENKIVTSKKSTVEFKKLQLELSTYSTTIFYKMLHAGIRCYHWIIML